MKDIIEQEVIVGDTVVITLGGTNLRLREVVKVNPHCILVEGIKRSFNRKQTLVVNKVLD
jgi:ribosomal protein L24